MRMIDVDALKTAIDNGWKPDMMVSEIWDIIDERPIVDAVPIVRCKDCKYYSGANDKDGYFTAIGFCNHESHHIMPLRYDFYCADAKKI